MEIIRHQNGKVACKVDWKSRRVEIKSGANITILDLSDTSEHNGQKEVQGNTLGLRNKAERQTYGSGYGQARRSSNNFRFQGGKLTWQR